MESTNCDAIRCGACAGGVSAEPTLLTCLHLLCKDCVPGPSSDKGAHPSSPDFRCPICFPSSLSQLSISQPSAHAPAFAASRIAAQPCISIVELDRKTASQDKADDDDYGRFDFSDDDNDDDEEDPDEGDAKISKNDNESYSSLLIFPCPQHHHRDAEKYCLTCERLACGKCATSVHRRCDSKHLVSCADAVVLRRPEINSLHGKLAQRVIRAQEALTSNTAQLQYIEEQRSMLVAEISKQREALVQAILKKEEKLLDEVNTVLDKEKSELEARAGNSRATMKAAEEQLSVLEAVLSVQGEAEILSLMPDLHKRLDAELVNETLCTPLPGKTTLVFTANNHLQQEVEEQDLGSVSPARQDKTKEVVPESGSEDLRLTHMTSFHGRTREDTCDPLLTDLVLLPNGDVILTDRDNRCVKKFNALGHLLTRVLIPETPSRIALVSQGKAAISVMNKKVLFFLSLLGTVRILSSVRLKKQYCFLAAAGQGLNQGQGPCHLLAATNQCDVIDLISENGALLKRLYTYKGERVSLSRPLYLHAPQFKDTDVAALVVDSGRRLLLALTSEGQITFTFKPKDDLALECPLGVATVPSGLVLLADRDKNRILLLGRRGTFLKDLLTEAEGLHKPCAICTAQPHRVALTQVDGWVKVYQAD